MPTDNDKQRTVNIDNNELQVY